MSTYLARGFRAGQRAPFEERLPITVGIGDWKSDIALAISGGDLDKLVSGVFSVNDMLVGMIQSRDGIIAGYRQAQAVSQQMGVVAGPPAPDDDAGQIAFEAMTAAQQGVEVFARQVQTLSMMNNVFGAVSSALTASDLQEDAGVVDSVTYQIGRFLIAADTAFASIPEYMDTKRQILAAAQAQWAAAGVASNAYDDPRWFQAYIAAADQVVPLPDMPGAPPSMSGLGNPLGQLAIWLLWVIAVIAATVAVIATTFKLIDSMNSKAVTARDLILQRDKEKEALRQQLVSQGDSQDDINQKMEEFDGETKRQTQAIPESSLSFSSLVVPIAVVAGGLMLLGRRS